MMQGFMLLRLRTNADEGRIALGTQATDLSFLVELNLNPFPLLLFPFQATKPVNSPFFPTVVFTSPIN